MWVSAASVANEVYPDSPTDPAIPVERGWRALAKGNSDSARFHFLEAHRLGMSRDSLCFLLAEAASGQAHYDTALVFNFSIPLSGDGPLGKMVLDQRLRIYSGAGMREEFLRLRDSLDDSRNGRVSKKWTLDWDWVSGYGLEKYHPVHEYPFSDNLGGRSSQGWMAKTQAGLSRAFRGSVPLHFGMGFDFGKSYYKDSVDGGITVHGKVGGPDRGIFLGLTFGLGRVTGVGNTGSGRADLSFLRPHSHGWWMVQAGFDAEWRMGDSRRYDLFWMAAHAEQILPVGNLLFAFTASQLRQNPLVQVNSMPLTFVDDPGKSDPVHFLRANFRDTLVDSTPAATHALITGSAGRYDVAMSAPQNVHIFAPALVYSLPLPFGFSGEAGARTEFLFYPDPYAWEEVSLPVLFQTGDFQALAMSQQNRELYGSVLRLQNGALIEINSVQPLIRHEEARRDVHWRVHVALHRPITRRGRLGLQGYFGDTRSTLSTSAPIWIPSFESGISLSWASKW